MKSPMPQFYKAPLRKLFLAVAYARPSFAAPYYCPVCERGLSHFRVLEWKDTRCVFCGSDTRQRLAWVFFHRMTDLFDGRQKLMLHVAPEIQFGKPLFKAIGGGYITADLLNPRAEVRMDITDIQYPADFFDVIVCSHVLEHVPDDRKAMREFVRVLKPKGWAAIMVPCFPDRGKTFEDLSVTDPADQSRLFGWKGHVRIYGDDFVGRLEQSGFVVHVIHAWDFLGPEEISRFNITAHSGDVFLCTKQDSFQKEDSLLSSHQT